MTHPTKAIYRWLLGDFVRVSTAPDTQQSLYTEADLSASFDRIETIDFHSTMEVNGIKFTAYHAGHVLGAAMYLIEIGGVKILFTGDYSREEDRHLTQAEIPPQTPDILITESTYGTGIHQQRLEKEARLMRLIHGTINKGGRCLLPVFALGRAQEILLILDEYWDAHPELEGVNIYYASVLARKCMAVFQTYVNMMNESIRKKFRDSRTNPFHFKHIKSIKNLDRFDDVGPCVMVAAPGMLQNGVSRELLERWAPDPRNALIVTGYSVEGTLAKQILNEPTEFPSFHSSETKILRRLSVDEIPFAAHVDFKQNSTFIDLVNAKNVILVHGETNNMNRLKSALTSKFSARKGTDQEIKIFNPRNCEELQLHFKSIKVARVVGDIATKSLVPASNDAIPIEGIPEIATLEESSTALVPTSTALAAAANQLTNTSVMVPCDGKIMSGILVEKDFHLNLVETADLKEYTGLTTSTVTEQQSIVVNAGSALVRYHLEQMFGNIETVSEDEEDSEKEGFVKTEGQEKESKEKVNDFDGKLQVKVMDAVTVTHENNIATIKWRGNIMNDAIADAVLGLLLSVDSSPASVKMSSKSCSHGHNNGHTHNHNHEVKNEKVKQEPTDSKDENIKKEPSDSTSQELTTTSTSSPPPPEFFTRVDQVSSILAAQFGTAYTLDPAKLSATIEIDGTTASIDFVKFAVECKSKALRMRVVHVLNRASYTVAPLAGPGGDDSGADSSNSDSGIGGELEGEKPTLKIENGSAGSDQKGSVKEEDSKIKIKTEES